MIGENNYNACTLTSAIIMIDHITILTPTCFLPSRLTREWLGRIIVFKLREEYEQCEEEELEEKYIYLNQNKSTDVVKGK